MTRERRANSRTGRAAIKRLVADPPPSPVATHPTMRPTMAYPEVGIDLYCDRGHDAFVLARWRRMTDGTWRDLRSDAGAGAQDERGNIRPRCLHCSFQPGYDAERITGIIDHLAASDTPHVERLRDLA